MRISDWSSDVCSSDLAEQFVEMFIPDFEQRAAQATPQRVREIELAHAAPVHQAALQRAVGIAPEPGVVDVRVPVAERDELRVGVQEAFDRGLVLQKTLRFLRSEEHTSELQSLMRNSYAVFCLKKKNKQN